MFTSALKSFSSNIAANYTLSANTTSSSGPWKIYDATKKGSGRAVSVFVFERKSLEPQLKGLSARPGASTKRAQDEVVERLKKEANSLARLRHPSILELAEPVEELRNGNLMFATEPVTSSLSELLHEKDEQERGGGVGGRSSRYVVGDAGGRRRREVEIDELEIQKGLLQIGKGLEFLHESAGLVHGNLTPDAVYVNVKMNPVLFSLDHYYFQYSKLVKLRKLFPAQGSRTLLYLASQLKPRSLVMAADEPQIKSDWKVSGLGFSGPPGTSTNASVPPIPLAEILQYDPRLPRSVQLNLDYTSPDFVLDHHVTAAADLFSLGILIVALYNSPHTSPLQTNSNLATYKKIFASATSTPSRSNNFLCSRPLPKEILSDLLPRLITRRPTERVDARQFQETAYFDNILVSTIRFLETLPAKTPNEKAQFMRGLVKVLPQFPRSVLEKKVLPALLEELKDQELLSLILQNVFRIVKNLPSRVFSERVIPKLREVFLSSGPSTVERNSAKEAGLMVLLEHMSIITENCSGKEFKADVLPISLRGLESPTPAVVDASLRSLPLILPVLDFSTLKNDLFPVIATVFSKTSSLGIKVRCLEAFAVLCGWQRDEVPLGDGLDGSVPVKDDQTKFSRSVVLDKYTIQEKIVPLLKLIKTREPSVMLATINVFKQVGKIADCDFIAREVLPILWSFALGPLLNLHQFKQFMDLTKSLSSRVEQEQTRKLQELNPNSVDALGNINSVPSTFQAPNSGQSDGGKNGVADDFERLVLGNKEHGHGNSMLDYPNDPSSWTKNPSAKDSDDHGATSPSFSWSTAPSMALSGQLPVSRAITPDQNLSGFAPLVPSTAPSTSSAKPPIPSDVWNAQRALSNPSMGTLSTLSSGSADVPNGPSLPPPGQRSTFSIPPPPAQSTYPTTSTNTSAPFSIAPPPCPARSSVGQPRYGAGLNVTNAVPIILTQSTSPQKQGLDKYESLL